ncbi:hypothetical protein B296_00009717 [Ensete ventricosum]|uniref:Association with the SNF1 complex (ASC) domain-containing protein n=1 Tax=Ensete ventricosum TaxID=4639 RepID=A0A427AFF3_ENSVE|nr:hypothetical protein B296_00009717 [Ensete ventricosum]
MGNISSVARGGREEGQGGSCHSQGEAEDLMGQGPPRSPRGAARLPLLFTPQVRFFSFQRNAHINQETKWADSTEILFCFYRYRFKVDGEWRYASDVPWMNDDMGNAHNILDLKAFVAEDLRGVAGLEMPRSPESSYNNSPLGSEDYSKEPPLVPPQLHLTLLNSPPATDRTSPLTKPPHVALNHLYIQKEETVVALGKTHRFDSKYVTVILYRSLAR